MNYYIAVLKKYAVFSGRAQRAEYWYFVLFNFIVSFALSFVVGLISDKLSFVSTLYSLAVLVPSLAVGVRRLHDIGKSGWWILIGLIPVVGWIIAIVWACTDSQAGDNAYGPNPKGVTAPAAPVTPPTK